MPDTAVYYSNFTKTHDDFGNKINEEFIDGATRYGPWGIMTPEAWEQHGKHYSLGVGKGQRYVKQRDGRWMKVEG